MKPKDLQTWRKKNGYSQARLARILGVTVVSISRWENGAREIPSFLHLALRCLELEGGGKIGEQKERVKRKRKETTHEGKHPEKR